jgi:hypothetical protein
MRRQLRGGIAAAPCLLTELTAPHSASDRGLALLRSLGFDVPCDNLPIHPVYRRGEQLAAAFLPDADNIFRHEDNNKPSLSRVFSECASLNLLG